MLTILFTDIEGSTALWESHPQAMAHALARHDAIVGGAVTGHAGRVLKGTGDGVVATFPTPSAAVEAALAAQADLHATKVEPIGELRVRMGLHLGTVEERDGDLFGPTMNRAARIMSAAHGGQLIASSTAVDQLGDADDLTITDLGYHRLKDLLEPARLFQIGRRGSDQVFPRLRSLPAQTNLPIDRSSFLGRQSEIEAATRLVMEHRLLTLVGPGGVGKTRLANHVVAEAADRYPHGAWFVPLAAVTDPAAIAAEVARILGLLSEDHAAPGQMLEDHVRTRRMALLIDNCEHLIDDVAALVERLLAAGPDLTVIATSREPLSIREEAVFRVEPLPIGPDEAAVRLFVDRAADAGTDLDADDPAIERICRRLDGLALAIELAAAKTRVLRLADLESRLSDRFSVLKRARGGADHHQTLAATIGWSYDLATPVEQSVLDRLSVFSGLFSLEWAAAVAGFAPVDELEVFEAVERLVDRSLISVATTEDPERYYLLESIKEFAAARLSDSGDGSTTHDRLITVVTNLTDRDPEPGTEAHAQWLASMHRNATSLRTALEVAHQRQAADHLATLVKGATPYWTAAGFAEEGLRWALAVDGLSSPDWLETLGDLHLAAHHDDEADRALEAALALDLGDVARARIIRKMTSRSAMVMNNLRTREGTARLEEALDLLGAPAPEWEDERVREWINLQLDLAGVGYFRFDLEAQRRALDAVLPWLERSTARQRVEYGITERGLMYQETRYRPRPDVAIQELEFRGTSPANQEAYGSALFRTAFYELLVHDVESAHARLRESAEIAEKLGSSIRLARVYAYYSIACRRLERIDECRSVSTRARRYAEQASHPSYTAVALGDLAWCDVRVGSFERGRSTLVAAAQLLAERAPRYPFHWVALLPLMEVHAREDAWDEIPKLARALLEPSQQRLPDDLEAAVLEICDSADPATADNALRSARRWRML